MHYEAERLDFVSAGRAFYPWLIGVGATKNTIGVNIDKNIPPSENLLAALSHCENVSPRWLMDGEGAPYIINDCIDDESCASLLAEYLEDETWSAYLLSDGVDTTIVLTSPCSFQRPRASDIHYTAVEVLPNAGQQAMSFTQYTASQLFTVELSTHDLKAISTGQLGTYALLGDKKKQGFLSDAKPVPMSET